MSLIVLLCGVMLKNSCDNYDNGNSNMGYRTKHSKINEDTWREANLYASKVYVKLGIISIIVLVIVSILTMSIPFVSIMITSFGVVPFFLIGMYLTEKHLKEVFDEAGNRKK